MLVRRRPSLFFASSLWAQPSCNDRCRRGDDPEIARRLAACRRGVPIRSQTTIPHPATWISKSGS